MPTKKTSQASRKKPTASTNRPKSAAKPVAAQPQEGKAAQKAAASRVRLPSVLALSKTAAALVWRNKKLFGGIALIYIICNILLVQTASATNLTKIKSTLESTSPATSNSVSTGLSLYSFLIAGGVNSASQAGAAYQSLLLVIVSLALIWALRETMAAQTVRVRDSFYKGMYPLVPSLLVLLAIFAQLIPLALCSFIFGLVTKNGIATNLLQLSLWSLLPLAGLCASVYFLISSLFAGYVVTLPDMAPLKALRSARGLVKYRRWTVLRKLLFVPFVFLVGGAVIMLPFVLWLTPVAAWVFFVLSTVALVLFQAYMYTLYRELLV